VSETLFYAAAISQDSNVRDFLEGALTDNSGKKSQSSQSSAGTANPGDSPFKSKPQSGQTSAGQDNSSSTASQGGISSKTSSGTGQKSSGTSQGDFKSSGSGGSTVTTGAPAFTQKQGTLDS